MTTPTSAELPDDFNPYRAPRADMRPRAEIERGRWLERCRVVPARHGIAWLREAWLLFRRQPRFLGDIPALALLGIILAPLLSSRPELLGPLCVSAFVFAGGVARMAHRVATGAPVNSFTVFHGFRRFFPLATVGLLCWLWLLPWSQLSAHLFSRSLSAGIALPQGLAAALLFPSLFALPTPALVLAPTLIVPAGHGPGRALLMGLAAGWANRRAVLTHWAAVAGLCLAMTAGVFVGVLTVKRFPVFFVLFLAGLALFVWLRLLLAVLGLAPYVAARDLFYEPAPETDGGDA